jgi:hypothetical protein
MISVLNCAERLFSGFKEKLQIKIVLEDRKEISSVSCDDGHGLVVTNDGLACMN